MVTGGLGLSGLLAHPDWAAVRSLGGPVPDGATVERVVTVADLHADPGEVRAALLTVAVSAPREDWHLDVLLRRAVAAGAVAVLLAGDAPLHPASRLLAGRMGLPVLGTPDALAAALTATRLLQEPDQVVAALVGRTAAVCGVPHGGVDDLVADLARTWRRPVWLLDPGGSVVAGADPAGPAPPPPAAGSALLEVAFGPGQPDGRLAVTEPEGVPAETAALRAALAVAANSVRQRLAEQRLTVERDARLRTALLAEILQAGDPLPAGLRRRALDAGWSLDGWHAGLRIDVPSSVDVVAAREQVLRAVETARLRAVVVEQGPGWNAWTTFDHEPVAGELQQHATAARRTQWLLRESLPTSTGVGRVHRGARGLARTLGEAGDAARLAAERTTSGRFVHVDRLGLGALLLAWTRTDTFLPAARSMLEPLQGRPGDLLTTLTAYLDAESSLTETAAVLGVHRNTVATRIERVRHVLGVDLADPDERLALHLACRSVLFHS
ncbi:putative regulatory protein [Pseudonocardia sp. Ae406_Ps2]|uniref:PucR family transcriptional regulator n=1 Tax=unclassified Pseudonocardia TaxID=2619320 RepID=UPI0009604C08|nr:MULTISPECIES: PucR family transcriptional regulator [unclassified Pseudonocardia]OLM00475.1 putative regulatory protein [Pseudonocardia sp. Ae406_Ps2]OLM07732.1 putative regulatory protein [Pseudonocardia sp. Ae331_Ps2]OLM22049.1 putative regulatory protein [Pseudonocardia sp. Ae706_Ps2]